mgnify:CR=1 FL=1
MQIGCPHIECIEQHFVQELNDGGVFDLIGACINGFRNLFRNRFVKIEFTASQALHRLRRGLCARFDQAIELVVFGNDPVHSHLGGELDFFCSFLISGVCGRNNQSVISLAENHHFVGLADFCVKQIFGKPLGVNGLQVQQRSTKNCRNRVRQI